MQRSDMSKTRRQERTTSGPCRASAFRALVVLAVFFAATVGFPVSTAHTPTHHATPDIVINATGTGGSCVTAWFNAGITSTPAGNWRETWTVTNDGNNADGSTIWEPSSSSHNTGLVVGGTNHQHSLYSKCFTYGSHGWLTVTVDVIWTDINGHHSVTASCHWGHGVVFDCDEE